MLSDNKEVEILYSSGEIHDSIKEVLSSPEEGDRRVVLAAFIGGCAEEYLPHPKGLEIVCWLQPGATDPLALERLSIKGSKIYKSERLHMKVYWSSRRGCVICSANVSQNALGNSPQKEAGVRLPPGFVDIDKLWELAAPEQIKSSDLKKLTCAAELYPKVRYPASSKNAPDFLEWMTLSARRDWKLGWWEEESDFSNEAIEEAKRRYNEEPCNFINVRARQVKRNEWLLLFNVKDGTKIEWLYVDYIVDLSSSIGDGFGQGYPLQAVQVYKSKSYPRPPFSINKSFSTAFRQALKEYGGAQIQKARTLEPKQEFLDLIAKKMQ